MEKLYSIIFKDEEGNSELWVDNLTYDACLMYLNSLRKHNDVSGTGYGNWTYFNIGYQFLIGIDPRYEDGGYVALEVSVIEE